MKQPYCLVGNGRYRGMLCKVWEIRWFLRKEKSPRVGYESHRIGQINHTTFF